MGVYPTPLINWSYEDLECNWGSVLEKNPAMKIITPRIPIRLPTNSTVSFRSACNDAKMKASIMPTTIIGIPTPTEICFEAIALGSGKNLYEFYVKSVYTGEQ